MTTVNNEAAPKGSRGILFFLKPVLSFVMTFILMFGTWVVLSGNFHPLLLWLGGISCFLVSFYFYDLLFPEWQSSYPRIFFRFIRYSPWLIGQIILANFHLFRLVFHPRMKELIDPKIVTLKTNLTSDIAITTLANSITLTPGTITITANKDGVFKIHAIDRKSAEGLGGTMLKKVTHIFGEDR